MVVVISKNRIAVILMIFLLAITVYSYNLEQKNLASTVANVKDQKIVVIDAGHGGEDPGAVSDYSGLSEKEVNLEIALKVRDLLEKENYKVIMTRTEDMLKYNATLTNIVQKRREDLLTRKKIMDESGADIVVSIHLNKFPQTKYFGAQTFFPPNSPESQRLARSIQQEIRDKIDPENKREALVKKDSIIILKNLKTPTTIVECGFLSNEDEEKKLRTKEYQEQIAVAIARGIQNYFEQSK